MDFSDYDLYFPHLGFGIKRMVNSVSPFGFRIAFYGIIIAIGMLLGVAIASWDYGRRGRKREDIQDYALVGIVLSVIGARIYYVIFSWDYYSRNLLEIPNIRQGGLAIYGGVITAFLSCYLFCRFRKISFPDMADSGVLGLILGQCIGRWGNFFNMEAFGGYTDSLFAMRIRQSRVNSNMLNEEVLSHKIQVDGIDYIQVHPTFFYESLWCLISLLIMLHFSKRKRFNGQIALMYLGLYGLGRFFIEGLRTDSLMLWGTGIAVSQALSLCLIILSIVLIVLELKRIPRK